MEVTALQQLIKWITDEVHPSQIKEQAEILLEIEQFQIQKAWIDGNSTDRVNFKGGASVFYFENKYGKAN